MPINIKTELIKKEQLKPNLFKFSVKSKEIANAAKPGHFLEIRVSDNIDPLLRRPISIYNIDKENNIVEFIFQVKGKGTEILSKKEKGELIDIIGPLGNGIFQYEGYKRSKVLADSTKLVIEVCQAESSRNKNISIIGGGIGTFPLYELAKNAKNNSNINVYLGFRDKDNVILENEFKNVSNKLVITTDDGSYGKKGFAIDFLKKDIKEQKTDCVFACGPLPMLKAVQAFALEENIPCQISLEERMGCGIGACLGCAVKIISGETPRYGHVCKDGPVFDARTVEI